jgi:hypothetical protein
MRSSAGAGVQCSLLVSSTATSGAASNPSKAKVEVSEAYAYGGGKEEWLVEICINGNRTLHLDGAQTKEVQSAPWLARLVRC